MNDQDVMRKFRERLSLTQEEAAARLGISSHTVASIEKGRRSMSPPIEAYLTSLENGDITERDTPFDALRKATAALKNGRGDLARRMAYCAIVLLS